MNRPKQRLLAHMTTVSDKRYAHPGLDRLILPPEVPRPVSRAKREEKRSRNRQAKAQRQQRSLRNSCHENRVAGTPIVGPAPDVITPFGFVLLLAHIAYGW